MKIRHLFMLSGVLVLLLSCAPVARQADIMAPDFDQLVIRKIAVAPVVFADEPLDWYFGERIAVQLRRETLRILESKGYEAALLGGTYLRYPPPGSELAALAPPVPEGADALLVIRLDHFLDAGRYDGDGSPINNPGNPSSVDLYATAALLDRGGRVLWQDSGFGGGGRGSGALSLDEFLVPAELAARLLATLPPARQ